MPREISRSDAWDLLKLWVKSSSLRRHMLAVEASMRAYAPRFGGDVEVWGVTGLLHDLDYERYPDLATGHPRYAVKQLSELDYPMEVIRAIVSHADYMGVPRETPMEKTLYAVDELSGFVMACSYVRPNGFKGMTVRSVKKKLSSASFAAAIDRDDIVRGAEQLGVELDAHIGVVVEALTERQEELMAEGAEGRGR
jgi:putative nucleotidyltransferase with HDIG domain